MAILLLACLAPARAAPPPTTAPGPIQSPALVERRILENIQLLTGNNEPQARIIGARGLLHMSNPAAWDRLVTVLRNPADPPARLAVCQAVADWPEPRAVLIEPLMELLGGDSTPLRQAAGVALARYRDPAVIARLLGVARDTALPNTTRQSAIEALGAMGDDQRAVEALVTLLDNSSPEIVSAALDAIADSSGAELLDADAARRWWEENRSLDTTAWLRSRNEQLRARIRRLESGNTDLTSRLLAALRNSFLATPAEARDAALLDLLNDPLVEVRSLGIELVNASITDRKSVSAAVAARVAALLADANGDVRRRAASVLGDLRDSAHVPLLAASLNRESDSRVRAAIVAALGRIGGPAAAKAVQPSLDDSSPAVVRHAAQALGELAQAGDASSDVARAAAAAVLARYAKIKPGDAQTREVFLVALARIGDPRARPLFLEALPVGFAPTVRAAAIRGLAAMDDGTSAARLRPLLEDPQPRVRLAAVEGLGRCAKSDDDLAALIDRLDESIEREEAIRLKAWEGFARLVKARPPEEAVAWVERFCKNRVDPLVQTRAIELLTDVDRRLAQRDPTPPLAADVKERLGDAHVTLRRYSAAASLYELAFDAQQAAASPRAGATVLKALSAQLAGRDFDKWQALIARTIAQSGGNGASLDLPAVAHDLEMNLSDLLVAQDTPNAAKLAAVARQWMQQAPSLSAEGRRSLEQLCTRADELAERQRIVTLIQQAADASGQSIDAVAELRRLGPQILPSLADELERRLVAAEPDDPGDGRLVELARELEPRWSGYPAGADAASRQKAISALRELLPAPPTTESAPSP